VGLLLGWHRAAEGSITVDGESLEGAALGRLRSRTAWIDPAVQLWNRSLLANLRYGADDSAASLAVALEAADLYAVLERLPQGLQTCLGEGGGLVSGGEGQRVRLGRALSRRGIGLAILDEPFRGLDRQQRRRLLAASRQLWRDVTLLCITHDVAETQAFDRVLVVEDGHLLEDDRPDALRARPDSRYRRLLEAEQSIRQELWLSSDWRHLNLADGRLEEGSPSIAGGDADAR
jgi:ATP-binding cassette subfamily B protein